MFCYSKDTQSDSYMHTHTHTRIQSGIRAWPDTDTYAMRTERTQRLVLRFLPPCPISPSQMNGNLALCALNKQPQGLAPASSFSA